MLFQSLRFSANAMPPKFFTSCDQHSQWQCEVRAITEQYYTCKSIFWRVNSTKSQSQSENFPVYMVKTAALPTASVKLASGYQTFLVLDLRKFGWLLCSVKKVNKRFQRTANRSIPRQLGLRNQNEPRRVSYQRFAFGGVFKKKFGKFLLPLQ